MFWSIWVMNWVMELSALCCSADQLSHQGLFGNWEMLGLMFNSLIPSKDFIWKESLNHACAGDVPISKSSASSKGVLKIKSLKDLFFLKEMKFFLHVETSVMKVLPLHYSGLVVINHRFPQPAQCTLCRMCLVLQGLAVEQCPRADRKCLGF